MFRVDDRSWGLERGARQIHLAVMDLVHYYSLYQAQTRSLQQQLFDHQFQFTFDSFCVIGWISIIIALWTSGFRYYKYNRLGYYSDSDCE